MGASGTECYFAELWDFGVEDDGAGEGFASDYVLIVQGEEDLVFAG
jgi:hypothetical protein